MNYFLVLCLFALSVGYQSTLFGSNVMDDQEEKGDACKVSNVTEDILSEENVMTLKKVAEIFLYLDDEAAKEKYSHNRLGRTKLHKLLYYAQGYYIGLFNQKLFKEKIKCMDHGPFLPDLEKYYAAWEPKDVQKFRRAGSGRKTKHILKISPGKSYEQDEINMVLREIFEYFQFKYGTDMADQTHQEDPWKDTNPYEYITDKSMKDYFQKPGNLPLKMLKISAPTADTIQKKITVFLHLKYHLLLDLGYHNTNFKEILHILFDNCNSKFSEDFLNTFSEKYLGIINTTLPTLYDKMLSCILFPDEWLPPISSNSYLKFNLKIQEKIARAVYYQHPFAQDIYAIFYEKETEDKDRKTLARSKAKKPRGLTKKEKDKRQAEVLKFKNSANEILDKILNHKDSCPYYVGLVYKYRKQFEKAKIEFSRMQDHPNCLYELAIIMEEEGEDPDNIFNAFKKSYDKGCEMALLRLGEYAENQQEQFTYFEEAGKKNIAQGFFQCAKMSRSDAPSYEKYLLKAHKLHYTDATIALGQYYEKNKNYKEAVKTYQEIANTGNGLGFIEWSRVEKAIPIEERTYGKLYSELQYPCRKQTIRKLLPNVSMDSWFLLEPFLDGAHPDELKSLQNAINKKIKRHWESLKEIIEGKQ